MLGAPAAPATPSHASAHSLRHTGERERIAAPCALLCATRLDGDLVALLLDLLVGPDLLPLLAQVSDALLNLLELRLRDLLERLLLLDLVAEGIELVLLGERLGLRGLL